MPIINMPILDLPITSIRPPCIQSPPDTKAARVFQSVLPTSDKLHATDIAGSLECVSPSTLHTDSSFSRKLEDIRLIASDLALEFSGTPMSSDNRVLQPVTHAFDRTLWYQDSGAVGITCNDRFSEQTSFTHPSVHPYLWMSPDTHSLELSGTSLTGEEMGDGSPLAWCAPPRVRVASNPTRGSLSSSSAALLSILNGPSFDTRSALKIPIPSPTVDQRLPTSHVPPVGKLAPIGSPSPTQSERRHRELNQSVHGTYSQDSSNAIRPAPLFLHSSVDVRPQYEPVLPWPPVLSTNSQ